MSMQQPTGLAGCHAKLARAREVTDSLTPDLDAYVATRPFETAGQVEGPWWVERVTRADPLPLRWSVKIGEVIHDLRSTLDHLVWQLVLVANRSPTSANQFPVCDRPADFADQSVRRLRGVDPAHVSIIEKFQPYHASPPNLPLLGHLRDLSNVDKHRVLATALSEVSGSQFRLQGTDLISLVPTSITPTFGPLEVGREIVRIEAEVAGPDVQLDANLELLVVFDDIDPDLAALKGQDVRGVCAGLANEVEELLSRFATEFP